MFRILLAIALTWALPALAEPLTEQQVPEPLKPWVDWVTHGKPELRCPVGHADQSRSCVWPGALSISATSSGATFEQTVTVFAQSRVALPGDLKHWPAQVRLDDQPVEVVAHGSSPALLLPAGSHRIAGRFVWRTMPSTLGVNASTGIIRYTLNGRDVRSPQFRDGRLWLRAGRQDNAGKTPEDSLKLEVYRLLADGHPFTVATELRIEVSGAQREVAFPGVLPDGFIALQLISKLPARIEPDGRLRVQVRPGSHAVRVVGRHTGPVAELSMPKRDAPWPPQEVWVYRSAPADRMTEVGGATQIDPRRVRLPADWASLPAYQLSAGDAITLKETRRGDPRPEPDQLRLQRDLWLDFSGAGFTVRDKIAGKMTSDWRLSVDPALKLGKVSVDGKPQFITRLAAGERHGVEVRRGALQLSAESRYAGDAAALPATGWGRDFQKVSATLHTPPGWQVLAVSGVDNAPGWLARWTLYDLFVVLIITLAVGKLWGWRWVPLSMLTLALTWHEPNSPQAVWLFLLACIALLRVVPASSKIFNVLRAARLAGVVWLVVVLMLFAVQQAREGLYPQLENRFARSAQPMGIDRAKTRRNRAAGKAFEPRLTEESAQSAPQADVRAIRARKAPAGSIQSLGASKRKLEQNDPNAIIQTGPGLPAWRWRTTALSFSGPVTKDQHIGLYLIGPRWNMALQFAMVGLILLLAWRFLDVSGKPGKPGGPGARGTRRTREGAAKTNKPENRQRDQRAGSAVAMAITFALLSQHMPDASAQTWPPAELLQELERRLNEQPAKAPRASIPEMALRLEERSYTAQLAVHALQRTAIPLPVDTQSATPVRVSLNDLPVTDLLFRNRQNQLWLLVPKGRSRVTLQVYLPPADQLQIPLPLRPHRIDVDATRWSVDGIDENGVPDEQVSIVRIREAKDAASTELTPAALPPFVRIERTLRFGINWEVHTTVRRASPAGASLSVQVPLLVGEAVVTDGIQVRNGKVRVSMSAQQKTLAWTSRFDAVPAITLKASDEPGWLETWRADIGPVWHATVEGLAPVHHQDSGNNWLPQWHPWPGETVTIRVERPEGVVGQTLTVDDSELRVKPGKRVTESALSFRLRSSQGGRHTVTIPPQAELQLVKINGRTQPIRADGAGVVLPVVPGEQRYELQWRTNGGMTGMQLQWRSPQVSVIDEHVNARLNVQVPRDRWILWLSGPRMGPAILIWGVLLVILIAALALASQSSAIPLGFLSWLLLGIGLSQVWATAALIVVGWFLLIRFRAVLNATTPKLVFNLTQVGVVLMTLLTFAIMFWAVQTGLLGSPQMQIVGNGSSAGNLNWYQDRVAGAYPQASVYSVPLLVYRLLMMAWALWLAFSMLKWLKWAWQAFSSGGLWRSLDLSIRRGQPAANETPKATPTNDAG